MRIQTKTFYKHALHPELQNVFEISSGLGKFQQEPINTRFRCWDWSTWKLFKTQHNGRHRSKTNPCIIHTWICLAGLFRLIQWITADRDIKRMQLPPEKSAWFLSVLFQTKHFGKIALQFAEWFRKGQWVGPVGAISNGKQARAHFLRITTEPQSY